jgi:hypothetical protein
MTPENRHDAAVQIANSGPSLAFVGATFAGVGIQDWLAITGIVFIFLQALYLLWRWRRDARIEDERTRSRFVEDETDL